MGWLGPEAEKGTAGRLAVCSLGCATSAATHHSAARATRSSERPSNNVRKALSPSSSGSIKERARALAGRLRKGKREEGEKEERKSW